MTKLKLERNFAYVIEAHVIEMVEENQALVQLMFEEAMSNLLLTGRTSSTRRRSRTSAKQTSERRARAASKRQLQH